LQSWVGIVVQDVPEYLHAFVDNAAMRWDIFCKVVDNLGDLGVSWRLCADLSQRGHQVRFWVDDATALDWIAPGASRQTPSSVQVMPMSELANAAHGDWNTCADVWVETFGCDIAPEFIASYADATGACGLNDFKFPVWINLEYLSAEGYVERSHALPSPVMQGAARGAIRHFFYPGFTPATGGLMREPDLADRQRAFDLQARREWLKGIGVTWDGERLIALFCYEPAALATLMAYLAARADPTILLVTTGRAAKAVRAALASMQVESGALSIHFLPAMSQRDFDHLLWSSDVNMVRGEDSLVRAIWAGKPLVWNIYPQSDGAHLEKLEAFLDCLGADPTARQFHARWNADPRSMHATEVDDVEAIWRPEIWVESVQRLRAKLLQMPDLTTRLIDFVAKKR
jgi:uncharacterized repeat protein (TIGR03837 family)